MQKKVIIKIWDWNYRIWTQIYWIFFLSSSILLAFRDSMCYFLFFLRVGTKNVKSQCMCECVMSIANSRSWQIQCWQQCCQCLQSIGSGADGWMDQCGSYFAYEFLLLILRSQSNVSNFRKIPNFYQLFLRIFFLSFITSDHNTVVRIRSHVPNRSPQFE